MTSLDTTEWAALSLSWADGSPGLRVRVDRDSTHVPLIGQVLRYAATDRRVCIGHHRVGGGTFDCFEPPDEGAKQCTSCRIRSAGFAANLHHAHTRPRQELSSDALRHLSQTNFLYLAAFRDGSLKVGTTTAVRRDTRLTEQGAWRARLVAEADDGFVVREFEDHVTEFLHVPQSVSVRRKLDGLVHPMPDAALDRLLDEHAAQVHAFVERLDDDRLRVIDEAWQAAATTSSLWEGVHEYPFGLGTGTHHVEVVDAVGRVAALRRPGHGDDVYAADLGDLYGVVITPGDFDTPEIAIQDSLF